MFKWFWSTFSGSQNFLLSALRLPWFVETPWDERFWGRCVLLLSICARWVWRRAVCKSSVDFPVSVQSCSVPAAPGHFAVLTEMPFWDLLAHSGAQGAWGAPWGCCSVRTCPGESRQAGWSEGERGDGWALTDSQIVVPSRAGGESHWDVAWRKRLPCLRLGACLHFCSQNYRSCWSAPSHMWGRKVAAQREWLCVSYRSKIILCKTVPKRTSRAILKCKVCLHVTRLAFTHLHNKRY